MSEAFHPDDDLADGETLADGRFRITGLVGLGATGVIYTAKDGVTDREVALKLLARRCVGVPDREARFDREGILGRTVPPHPNLVRILDAGRTEPPDNRLWLALEFVRGPTLAQLRSREVLGEQRLAKLMLDVARGVAALHAAGIVHRDLKPANVLVEAGGEGLAKIADLGLAVRTDTSSASRGDVTRADQRPGTVNYMAPEQIGGVSASPTLDVYALGATFYEAAVGKPPYADLGNDDIAQRKLEKRPPEPSVQEARPDLCIELTEIIEDCLRFEAAERPTAAMVVERLERLTASPLPDTPGRRWALSAVVAAGVALMVWGIVSMLPDDVARDSGDAAARSSPREGAMSVASSAATPRDAAVVELERPPQRVPSPAATRAEDDGDAQAPQEISSPRPPASANEADGGGLPSRTGQRGRPQAKAPSEHSAEAGPDDPLQVERPDASEQDCTKVQASARAAQEAGRWKDLLRETKDKTCFPRRAERAALRVRAYAELRQWPQCIREGADLDDASVRTWVDLCRKKAME